MTKFMAIVMLPNEGNFTISFDSSDQPSVADGHQQLKDHLSELIQQSTIHVIPHPRSTKNTQNQ